MYSSLDSLEADVLNNIEQANFGLALDLIIQFVQYVIRDPKTTAVIFGSERLDRLCLAIGNAMVKKERTPIARDVKTENSESHVVTLATHLERYGGHTLVMEDVIRAQPEKSHIILLIDLFNLADLESLTERLSPIAEFRVAPRRSILEKMEWLLDQLEAITPDRIILFNHHEDAVAIASMQPWVGSAQIIFYHHADHALCLGVHLPEVIHIDPHNMGYDNCKAHEALRSNRYLPLAVPDSGCRPTDLEFLQNGIVRTCSSGTSHKFHQPYSCVYSELISKMLAQHGGVHFHIGNLSDDQLDTIRLHLKREGVDTFRFVHIPWVSSLWSALIENRIDLYISSFPLGGGRATIEAMGSGTPLLMHESYLSRFHGGVDLAFPRAFVWRNPTEFFKHITSLDLNTLRDHSRQARQHYETNHLPEVMASELNYICSGEGSLIPPQIKSYIPDDLQKYLHVNATETSLLAERNERISSLNRAVAERDSQIVSINQAVIERDAALHAIRLSHSWRLTAPLRFLRRILHNNR